MVQICHLLFPILSMFPELFFSVLLNSNTSNAVLANGKRSSVEQNTCFKILSLDCIGVLRHALNYGTGEGHTFTGFNGLTNKAAMSFDKLDSYCSFRSQLTRSQYLHTFS